MKDARPLMQQIPEILAALLCGAIFGFGLALSGMLDPARVRGFLDIFGHFDASLAFVLAGAVMVSTAGIFVSRKLRMPILGGVFYIPERRKIDAPLVLGSAIFGVGWGMGGFCPGPAVAALSLGLLPPFVFTAAMLAGILLHDHGWRKHGEKAAPIPLRQEVPQEEVDA